MLQRHGAGREGAASFRESVCPSTPRREEFIPLSLHAGAGAARLRLLAIVLAFLAAFPLALGAPVAHDGDNFSRAFDPVGLAETSSGPSASPAPAPTRISLAPADVGLPLPPRNLASRDDAALAASREGIEARDSAALPHDLSDADLVLLLARHAGIAAAADGRPLLAPAPKDATVGSLVLDLAHRSGARSATPADVAIFAQLDPRVAAPLVTLLGAIDQAWDLRDAAVAGMPDADQRALARMVLDGAHETPEAQRLAEPIDRAALVDAAILLLDAAEAVVIPQLQAAADAGAWPAEPVADPLGILRIGGTGDDEETMDRLLQIDPRGNDTYRNNAGGTTLLADLDPATLDYPIAMSLDFGGDDSYTILANRWSMGSAFLGAGLLHDLEGNDEFRCTRLCQGAGLWGVGVHRDYAGDDNHRSGDTSLGSATLMGILREDGGEDGFLFGTDGGGYGAGPSSIGLLWERGGRDMHETTFEFTHNRLGWGKDSGRGLFVEEGPEADYYETEHLGAHGCNDCTWTAGNGKGTGSDNSGNLLSVLHHELDMLW